MNAWVLLALTFPVSVAASLAALAIWFHFDIEGWWQQRRLEHGKRLDERQRRAAEEHHHYS